MSAEPDLFLGGRLRLRQPARGAHRAGTDAALLAAFLTPRPGETLCDAGAATGAVGLAVASRVPGCRVLLVERDPALAALARRNAEANGMAERVAVVEADLLASGAARRACGLPPGAADLVLTNPPFFEGADYRPSPNAGKAAAHAFGEGGLERWLRASTDLLAPHGRLGLIHRADALPACLALLHNRFGAVTVRPVLPRADRPAIRVLVGGVKGSRAPFSLLPALVLHDAHGRLTPEAEACHRGMPWPA